MSPDPEPPAPAPDPAPDPATDAATDAATEPQDAAALPDDTATKLTSGDYAWVDDRGAIPVEEVGLNPGHTAIIERPFQLER